ncbi:pre-mRNA processing RNA-helicase [Rhizophlyctis rosea]|nr:pre-mRNA processing RNA-helicase [Rhizophlyctis rosea]
MPEPQHTDSTKKPNATPAVPARFPDAKEAPTTAPTDGQGEEEPDLLEDFMKDVNSKVQRVNDTVPQSPTNWITNTQPMGDDDEADDDDGVGSDSEDIIAATAKKLAAKRTDLAQVDHSAQRYEPFRENFYVEPQELQNLTEEQVDEKRAALVGIKVRGVDCPEAIEEWTSDEEEDEMSTSVSSSETREPASSLSPSSRISSDAGSSPGQRSSKGSIVHSLSSNDSSVGWDGQPKYHDWDPEWDKDHVTPPKSTGQQTLQRAASPYIDPPFFPSHSDSHMQKESTRDPRLGKSLASPSAEAWERAREEIDALERAKFGAEGDEDGMDEGIAVEDVEAMFNEMPTKMTGLTLVEGGGGSMMEDGPVLGLMVDDLEVGGSGGAVVDESGGETETVDGKEGTAVESVDEVALNALFQDLIGNV